jgi:hypothetical protein
VQYVNGGAPLTAVGSCQGLLQLAPKYRLYRYHSVTGFLGTGHALFSISGPLLRTLTVWPLALDF